MPVIREHVHEVGDDLDPVIPLQSEGGGEGTPTSRTITAGTGLTGGGDLTANRTLAADFGAAAGKVTQGNDARLSDARTPSAHAASHEDGGSDPVTPAAVPVLEGIEDQFASTGAASEVMTADGAGTMAWQAVPFPAAPTLEEVLAAGNDPGGFALAAATDPSGATGALLAIAPGALTGVGGVANLIGGNGNGDAGGEVAVTGGAATAGSVGGTVTVGGGVGNGGGQIPAKLFLAGSGAGAGTAGLLTKGLNGEAGQFLGSDGADGLAHLTPLIRNAAGVPAGAPGIGELPVAFDTTAVTGGLYCWTGAAWVQVSTIP